MCDDEQEIAAAEQILDYLSLHPKAADTAEGVARWWLRRQRFEVRLEVVARALERLFREGVVSRTLIRNGNSIYRRRHQVYPTIRREKSETLN
jgi:Fe2+ or Zn2+ uptake regulation protein